MAIPLKVLIIEDSDSDVVLDVREMEKAGYQVTHEIVATAKEMKAALHTRAFDIIISDYNMPQFDGLKALALLKESGLDIPFIVVSGAIGEETAVKMMKAGAQDYVMKGNLTRLGMAVGRELQEAAVRRERNKAEKALRRERDFSTNVVDTAQAIILTLDTEGRIIHFNRYLEEISGYNLKEVQGKSWFDTFLPEREQAGIRKLFGQAISGIQTRGKVNPIVIKDGRELDIEWYDKTMTDASGNITGLLSIGQDITDRMRAETELKQSNTALEKAMQDTVRAMAVTCEMRDPYTAGHQQRVAQLVVSIAEELLLSDNEKEGLRTAAFLHDIGKMNIPTEILSKPGKLATMEYSLVKEHVQSGYDILKGIDFPWLVAQIVYQHHERMDGSGYPNALSGEDIKLEARILAVADVVEAMTSHRPYRPALGKDKALEEISNNRGKLYDADVVDACLKLFTEKGFKFE